MRRPASHPPPPARADVAGAFTTRSRLRHPRALSGPVPGPGSEPRSGSKGRSTAARRRAGPAASRRRSWPPNGRSCQPLRLFRAGQYRGLDHEHADQHGNDGPRDAAHPAKCPREQGQRPGHVLCGETLPEVQANRPAADLHASRHGKNACQDQQRPAPAVRSKTAVTSVSCRCSDPAVCAGGVPARSRAVLRQKATYSKHPHDETAR